MSESLTQVEMINSLRQSGYMLESRLVEKLDDLGMFVEPSCAYLDLKTGVSREIDIVAEEFRYDKGRSGVCVKTIFIVEAIHNPAPAVLITPKKWSPNTVDDDLIPHCISPGEDLPDHPFLSKINLLEEKAKSRSEVYSQFCGFTKKKNGKDWMASHQDDLYGSIKKATEYALTLRDEANAWMSKTPEYYRIFQWRPMVVFGGQIFALKGGTLVSEHHSHLFFNLHFQGVPKSVLVDFVTEDYFPKLVMQINEEDDGLEDSLYIQRRMKE